MDADQVQRSWEHFLDPEILRPKLISASLYLTAFEMLKQSIIQRIRDFFTLGFNEEGDILDPSYQQKVLSRNKSPLYASLSWLRENEAIEQSDVNTFEELKACRNKLAHEMPNLAFNASELKHIELFPKLVALLNKIETWWVINVEIPTNADFDSIEIDHEGIVPGPLMTIKMMLDIALGSNDEANAYLKHLKEMHASDKSLFS